MLDRHHLHAYQLRFVDFIKERRRVFGLLEMGLGKSVSTLTAVADLLDGFQICRVLVIAPLRVANSVWAQEARRWAHLSHLRVSVCTGAEDARKAALGADADVFVINRENIPWLVELCGKRWPFDCVVIDESSSFKSPSAKRFKALRKVIGQSRYVVALTGTPSPNSLLDLWSQVALIDGGASLGKTFSGYRDRFFESDFMGYRWNIRDGAADKIHALIAPFSLSMGAADYLELPDRIDIVERVTLPPKATAYYRELERELIAELPSGETIEAVNAAVLAGKLLQAANGATYTDDAGNWAPLHDAKIDALRELVELNDEPTLVAYNYKSDLARLRQALPGAVVLDKDPAVIERWNRGEIRQLLAHPASAGHGLNLQAGGSLMVWFGLSWSLELYQQFCARLHRQGQGRPVRVVHLVAEGTIDQRVLTALSQKDATQRGLLSALKP